MSFNFLTKRKIILFVAGLLLFPFALVKPAQAFSTPSDASYQFLFEQAVFQTDEMNLQSYVYETMKAINGSMATITIGCLSCKEGESSPGLIATTGQFIAGMYASPPASGVQYMADLGKQIGIVQPAYAQERGTGFQAMKQIQPAWKALRDVSYVFFVLIFIFVGFAIMFRVKINPQAVITIQSALPKIILALILVTFSYAIVGFMLDLMYVLLGLTENLFLGKGGLFRQTFGWFGEVLDWLETEATALLPGVSGAISSITKSILVQTSTLVILGAIFLFGPVGWVISLIVIILIFIAVLRCAWTLLKAYAMIIISLVTAPFQILIGTLPGSNAIGSWFKNLLANILVFPVMLFMFYLSVFLTLSGIMALFPGELSVTELAKISTLFTVLLAAWLPGIGTIPLLAIGTIIFPSQFLAFFNAMLLPIIGIMILLMTPKAADMVKAFITGQPFGYGAAIGETMGPARAAAGYGVIAGTETIYRRGAASGGPWAAGTRQQIAEAIKTAIQKRAGG